MVITILLGQDFGIGRLCLFILKILFILTMLGLCCCPGFFLQLQFDLRLLSSCDMCASHCGDFFCGGAWALGHEASVVAAFGLSSCGFWSLEYRLSSFRILIQLLCSIWDLLDQGSNWCPVHCRGGFLTTGPPGKPLGVFFFSKDKAFLHSFI